MKELINIQSELKAPKNQRNNFGKYNYRSCEDILEAVKPLLKEQECALTISDDIIIVGDRIYVKATVTIRKGESQVSTSAMAREPLSQKGMSECQITGSASSYARKYALNGLFAIDDTKDADATNQHGAAPAKPQFQAPKIYLISDAQQKRLMTIANGLDVPTVKAVIAKYGFDSSKKITTDKYETICKEIESLKTK